MPSIIRQEDPQELFSIIEARAAQHIIDQLNDDPSKLSESQQRFWSEIEEAMQETLEIDE